MVAILLALVMAFSIIGCGAKEEASAPVEEAVAAGENVADVVEEAVAEGKTSVKVAYLTDTIDQSQALLIENMEGYCAYFAEQRGIEVEFEAFDAKFNLQDQIAQLENCVTMGFDGVVLNCVDAEGIIPAVDAARADGLIINDCRSTGYEGYDLSIDVANETRRGELMKEWILNWMDENPDEVLYVGLIHGAQTTPQCFPRIDIPETIAQERPDNFIVLAEQYCPNWTTDDAMKIMEDWLQAYPEMNFVISSAEQLAYGVAEVIDSAGIGDQFRQVTVNGEPMGIEMMRNGELLMDCGTFAPASGGGMIKLLLEGIVDGKRGDYEYSEYTVFFMTPENVDEVENRYNTFEYSELGDAAPRT